MNQEAEQPQNGDQFQILDRATRQAPERNAFGHWMLVAERDWIIQGPEEALKHIQTAFGSTYCETFSPGLLLLRFGNSVGFFDVPHIGRVEVVSGKWGQEHFDQMLADVMAVASALPFSAGTGGALPYDRSVLAHKDVLYHAFVYLRYILSRRAPTEHQLLLAAHLILHDPHRLFKRVTRRIPIDQASRVSTSSLVKILSQPGLMFPVRNAALNRLPLVRALDGHLPAEVLQNEVRSTLDTPENRFILMFLRFAEGVISGMDQALAASGGDVFAARIRRDCAEMMLALAPVRRNLLWDEVGVMVHLPASSTVLQRRRGYREVFHHFSKMRMATRLPLSPQQARDLLEAKDIALLYELWTFYQIVDTVTSILGPPTNADAPEVSPLQISVPHGLRVSWSNDTALYYNRSFSRSAPLARRSYSVPLRPDIALEVPAGPNQGLHLFDAKFRLDRVDAFLPDNEETEEEATLERQGTFKRADLYKMHTYRDAIDRTRSVWILYPGTTFRLFQTDGRVCVSLDKLPDGILSGVGAIPLQPVSARGALELTTVLQKLLGG